MKIIINNLPILKIDNGQALESLLDYYALKEIGNITYKYISLSLYWLKFTFAVDVFSFYQYLVFSIFPESQSIKQNKDNNYTTGWKRIDMHSINLTVKDSPVHGKGLFSTIGFKKDEVLTLIHGELINADECVRREDEEDNVYIFYKDEDEYIDASNQKQLKYLNHSCDYNCDIEEDEKGNLFLFAVTNISAGDELTIDYGYDEIYQYCTCSDCENKSV